MCANSGLCLCRQLRCASRLPFRGLAPSQLACRDEDGPAWLPSRVVFFVLQNRTSSVSQKTGEVRGWALVHMTPSHRFMVKLAEETDGIIVTNEQLHVLMNNSKKLMVKDRVRRLPWDWAVPPRGCCGSPWQGRVEGKEGGRWSSAHQPLLGRCIGLCSSWAAGGRVKGSTVTFFLNLAQPAAPSPHGISSWCPYDPRAVMAPPWMSF